MSMSSISIGRGLASFVTADPGKAAVEMKNDRSRQADVEAVRAQVRREVEEQYRARYEEQEKKLSTVVSGVDEAVNCFMEDFEKKVVGQMLEMSLRIAEMIIRSRLPDRDMVADVIRKTLSPIMDLHGVRIKLSAADAGIIDSGKREDLTRILKQVELAVDNELKDGDVVVESRNGYFNARLDERMKLLETRLKERCGNVTS